MNITQQELNTLDIQLAALEEYLRYREKGHKIKVVFGLFMFLMTLGIGVYFYWLASFYAY